MKDLVPVLSSFGLTESECIIYLRLLESGSGSAGDLAAETHLSRQTTYAALQRLVDLGLISKATFESATLFHAEPLTALIAYAQRREVEFRDRVDHLTRSLPELELLYGKEKPAVKIYEGRESILAALVALKRSGVAEIYEIADLTSLENVFSPEDLSPLRRETAHVVPTHGIYRLPPDKQLTNPHAHALPSDTAAFHGNVAVFGDTVMLMCFEGKQHSVVIHSRAIAQTIRLLFAGYLRALSRDAET